MQETIATLESAGAGGGAGVLEELPQLSESSIGVLAAMPKPSRKKERRVHSDGFFIGRLALKYSYARESGGAKRTGKRTAGER